MQEAKLGPQISFSIGRMFMMSVLSIILVFSVYFTAFTPYPLGLAIVLFGRKIGLSILAIAVCAFYFVSVIYIKDLSVFSLYFLSACMAAFIGEVILRSISPIKGIVAALSVIVVVFGGSYLSQKTMIDREIKVVILKKIEAVKPMLKSQIEELKSSPEGSAYALQSMLEKPEPFIEKTIEQAPGYILMGFTLMLWLNMFLLLKSSRVLKAAEKKPFTEKVLLNFKMPEKMIFFFLVGMGMYLWSDLSLSLLGVEASPWISRVGLLVIQILGIFYFFHGFGIYMAFLDCYKIKGFFRSILMVVTILVANEVLALIGLFDMFVNFRKYLKKETLKS